MIRCSPIPLVAVLALAALLAVPGWLDAQEPGLPEAGAPGAAPSQERTAT
jgi:hypothetical protein